MRHICTLLTLGLLGTACQNKTPQVSPEETAPDAQPNAASVSAERATQRTPSPEQAALKLEGFGDSPRPLHAVAWARDGDIQVRVTTEEGWGCEQARATTWKDDDNLSVDGGEVWRATLQVSRTITKAGWRWQLTGMNTESILDGKLDVIERSFDATEAPRLELQAAPDPDGLEQVEVLAAELPSPLRSRVGDTTLQGSLRVPFCGVAPSTHDAEPAPEGATFTLHGERFPVRGATIRSTAGGDTRVTLTTFPHDCDDTIGSSGPGLRMTYTLDAEGTISQADIAGNTVHMVLFVEGTQGELSVGAPSPVLVPLNIDVKTPWRWLTVEAKGSMSAHACGGT
jgi:hypothetical protein